MFKPQVSLAFWHFRMAAQATARKRGVAPISVSSLERQYEKLYISVFLLLFSSLLFPLA